MSTTVSPPVATDDPSSGPGGATGTSSSGGTTGDASDHVLPASRFAIFFLGALAGTQAVDPTIASTALVKASRGLGMSGGLLALAASLSTLMLAATVVSAGLLGDRLGWRRLLTAGLTLAVVGDVASALAPASMVYLVGRALAGIGLGAVFAGAFAYIRIITPKKRMAAALGLFSATGSIVLVTFSVLGGVLASTNWRAAFLIVPAACVAYIFLARILLPRTGTHHSGPADVSGQLLLALGIIGVLVGFSHAAKGLGEPLTWGPMLVGLVLLVGFYLRERHGSTPFFPVEVLRHPLFLGALCAGFIYNFAQSATVLQFSNLWQYVDGLAPVRVSLGLMPFLLVGVVAALVTGRLLNGGMQNRTAILIGGAVVAVGSATTLLHHEPGHYWMLLPALLMIGYGTTMSSIPFGSLVVKAASGKLAAFYGPITSSRTTFGQVAYALGLAVSTVMVDRLTTGGTVAKMERAGVPPSRTGTGLDAVSQYAQYGKQPKSALGIKALELAKDSYAHAFTVTMIAIGVASFLVGLLGFTLLRRAAHLEAAADADDAPVTVPAGPGAAPSV